MYLGVDWYPDQWGLEQVDEDLNDIVELGCNIVRIADFAWHIFEPKEDVFDFSFFDEVVEKVKKHDLKILFCIPTATMPVWLAESHPDAIAEDEQGNKIPFGGRRSYCTNSSFYRKKAVQLTKELVRHYRDEKTIIGWQIDNEIGHEGSDMCWCDQCKHAFQAYLQERYHNDINDLNHRWGNDFWSHCYTRFDQIPLPKKAFTAQNPTLRLEWERFRSLSCERFIQAMYEAVKEENPDAFVIHDFSGGNLEKHYNPFQVAKHMDAVAFNNYPVWGGMKEPHKPSKNAFYLDAARGLRQQNFWVTESIMGAQGHDVIGAAPLPDQAKLWAMQSLAHGCDNLLFFRYRGFNRGAEQYCFGIVDADNRKKRKYREVQHFFQAAKEWARAFQGPISNQAAILFDYDSAASFRIQSQSNQFTYENELYRYYEPLWEKGIGVDVLPSDADFSHYRLLIVPSMIVMSEEMKHKLHSFVEQGGTLVLTVRSAWKDTDNVIPFKQVLPAGLTDLVGATLEEHESLLDDQSRPVVSTFSDATGVGHGFAEMMQPTTAKVLYAWEPCAFGEYAAATVNRFGKGTCYYFATDFDVDNTRSLMEQVTADAGLNGTPNHTTETVYRQNGDDHYKIELHYNDFTWHIQKV